MASQSHHSGIETRDQGKRCLQRPGSQSHHSGIETPESSSQRALSATLNRTILELKQRFFDHYQLPGGALNRTILELKRRIWVQDPSRVITLNRTILELKRRLTGSFTENISHSQSHRKRIKNRLDCFVPRNDVLLSIGSTWNVISRRKNRREV